MPGIDSDASAQFIRVDEDTCYAGWQWHGEYPEPLQLKCLPELQDRAVAKAQPVVFT